MIEQNINLRAASLSLFLYKAQPYHANTIILQATKTIIAGCSERIVQRGAKKISPRSA